MADTVYRTIRRPGFRIAARTILELGAELISSDGIALYELLKNAVDAGSARVRIDVRIALRRARHADLLAAIDDAIASSDKLTKKGIADKVAELKEASFNALEADILPEARAACNEMLGSASGLLTLRRLLNRFYDRNNSIVVQDWGEGMSLADLDQVYLTIGTRSRQRHKEQRDGERGYLGEKGVGRLSTMRLGGLLRIATTKADERRMNHLDIDWDRFSHDSDDLLDEVVFAPRQGPRKEDATNHGTTVAVRRLKSDWSREKFLSIVLEEFSRLVDPFETRKAQKLLRLHYNGVRQYVPELERRLFEIAHAECTAKFSMEDGKPALRTYINYRHRGREKTIVLREPELRGSTRGYPWRSVLNLGPFDLEMWWFNRALLSATPGLGKKSDVQRLVRRWSGGLMLFRDGFRINPYGNAEDDWLGLDKKAFGSRGFKLNRQQVIGRVRIGWRNKGLVEQTNREGLTDTPERTVFVNLLKQVVFGQFKEFLDTVDKDTRQQQLTTIDDLREHVEKAQSAISRKIREVLVRAPSEKQALTEIDGLVRTLNDYIEQAQRLAEEYQSDRAKFVYLAGIGLMVEFILHELGRATALTLDTLKDLGAGIHAAQTTLPATVATLQEQLSTINKRVQTLDPLSTSRRQRKEDFDVCETIRLIVDGRRSQAARHKVMLRGEPDQGDRWIVKGVVGMFIQIVENLLSNSFYWLDVQRDMEPGLDARIEFAVDRQMRTVIVTDNGSGVDPAHSRDIFEAFVSHRAANGGKGLGLYISREIADYNDWTLDILAESTVRPSRFNSFVLTLGETAL